MNYVISNGELYHYGVKGMRWGVRRTPAQLGRRVDKLSKANKKLGLGYKRLTNKHEMYKERAEKVQARNTKYDAKLDKATIKKAKWDTKVYSANHGIKQFFISDRRAAKYMRKSAKYENKMNKAKKKMKHDKWTVKAVKTQRAAKKAEKAIQKNEKLINTYNSTLKALDAGTVKQGALFMQYVLED